MAVLAVLVAQACGAEQTAEQDRQQVSVVLQPVDGAGVALTGVDEDSLDETVEIIVQRLGALEVPDARASKEGDSIRVTVPSDHQDVIDLVGTTARLRFRPVLAVLPPEPTEDQRGELEAQAADQLGTELTPREDIKVDEEVVLADSDGVIYRLGPTFTSGDKTLEGEAVEDATAGLNQTGEWVVNPVFRGGADGIDLFNAAASACYNGDATCPAQQGGRGQLAIVLDGEVLTAPSINEATFARDQIQISGSFDQESAQAVAVALRYGSLPLDLQPR